VSCLIIGFISVSVITLALFCACHVDPHGNKGA
jgi:hypothetical protein